MDYNRICLVLMMLAGSHHRVLTGAQTAEPTLEAITSSSSLQGNVSQSTSSQSTSSSSSSGTTFQADAGFDSSLGTVKLTSTAPVMSTATVRMSAAGQISTGSLTAINTSTSATGMQLPLSTDSNAGLTDVANSSWSQTPESPFSFTATRVVSAAASAAANDTRQTTTAGKIGWNSSAATGSIAAFDSSSTGRTSSSPGVRGNTTTITATGLATSTAHVTTAMPSSGVAGGWMMLVFIILAVLLAAVAIISGMFMLFRHIGGHSGRAAKHRQTANPVGNSYEHFHNQAAAAHGLSSLAAAHALYIGPSALDDESLDIGCSDKGDKPRSAPPPYNQLSTHPNSIVRRNSNSAPDVDYWHWMSTFQQNASDEGSTFPGFEDDGIHNVSYRDSEDGIARTAL